MNKFGRHFMADLYFCQNELWNSPVKLVGEIRKIARTLKGSDFNLVFRADESDGIRISGEIDESFVLIQIFPEKSFLTLDIFSWQPQVDIQNFSEGLIELFVPQVINAESKLRAEHLSN